MHPLETNVSVSHRVTIATLFNLQATVNETAVARADVADERIENLEASFLELALQNAEFAQDRYTVRMTAVQFAEHNEFDDYDVSLNILGKIAKRLAGEDYLTIPHIAYGRVGYLPVEVWMKALVEYYRQYGWSMTVRMYANTQGIELTHSDRLAIEGVGHMLSRLHEQVVSYTAPTKNRPDGVPMFQVETIDAAMGLIASVEQAHIVIQEFRNA